MQEVHQATHFIELHEQVETSVKLLSSLEDFLATFQKDLSSVSSQITDLQQRSREIDERLKPRRNIEAPLSNLLSTITIPPALVTLIVDTNVGEPWLAAIDDFQQRLTALNAQKRIRATKDLTQMVEGLRIAAATKIRSFFLALFKPIRTSMSTNLQVLQSTVILKYRPLYEFLKRHAVDVAQELQASYIAAARVYYETGFRRYSRNLGYIKSRSPGNTGAESIVSAAAVMEIDATFVPLDVKRLSHSRISGQPVTLAYMADDKLHVDTTEALFRSLMLVLMDNGAAEYTFVASFFYVDIEGTPEASASASFNDLNSEIDVDQADSQTDRQSRVPVSGVMKAQREQKQTIINIWKQIMDPSLDHCQNFVNAVLNPSPDIISLLVMTRLLEEVVAEVNSRQCESLESFLFRTRLQFWTVFQSLMTENLDGLNKFINPSSTTFFSRRPTVTDSLVRNVAQQCAKLCFCMHVLNESQETVIVTNLNRIRELLLKLIIAQSKKAADISQTLRFQSTLFGLLISVLKKYRNDVQGAEIYIPEAGIESEITFWATKRANMQKDGSEPPR